jgi:hypothetical protein
VRYQFGVELFMIIDSYVFNCDLRLLIRTVCIINIFLPDHEIDISETIFDTRDIVL